MNRMRLAVFEGATTTDNFELHTGVSRDDALKELIAHIRERESMLRNRIVELKRKLKCAYTR